MLATLTASLAACAGDATLLHIQQDTYLFLSALHGLLPGLTALPVSTVPPASLASIRLNVQESAIFGGDIASAQSTAQAVTPVGLMVASISQVLQEAAPLQLPPDMRSVFAAVGTLLPVIQAQTGINAPPVSAAAASYTPDQARFILQRSVQLHG